MPKDEDPKFFPPDLDPAQLKLKTVSGSDLDLKKNIYIKLDYVSKIKRIKEKYISQNIPINLTIWKGFGTNCAAFKSQKDVS